jgi:peptidoglycan-associated lipoprotein
VRFFDALGVCEKTGVKPSEPVVTPPTAEQQQEAKAEAQVRYPDWETAPQIKVIRFDYDSSNLNEDARAILKNNAEFLKGNPDLSVLVEGHCDERGTTEYNLALGQRRASAVREYYGQLGVTLGRIGTISYGKEQPVDPAHDENAWAKNRRAETKVRSGK